MPLSRARDRERKRAAALLKKKAKELGVSKVMSSADVRALKRSGLDPEKVGNETGKVSASIHYAVVRELEAVKAHLGWHHEAVKYPDVGTTIERLQTQVNVLTARTTQLEAELVAMRYSDSSEAERIIKEDYDAKET